MASKGGNDGTGERVPRPSDLVQLVMYHSRQDYPDDPDKFERLVSAAELIICAMDALTERRRQLGLTQTDVARSMGTTQPAIAKIETHRQDPTVLTLAKYASAVRARLSLAISPEELYPDDSAEIDPPRRTGSSRDQGSQSEVQRSRTQDTGTRVANG
jgi:transcriptional regulator with XRE-family HTH domain